MLLFDSKETLVFGYFNKVLGGIIEKSLGARIAPH